MYVVSDKVKFIRSVFGSGKISGNNITVHCPECAHAESGKKKLSIRLDDDVNHCWVCGWGARTLLPLVIKHGTREQVAEYKERFLPQVVDVAKYKSKLEAQEKETKKTVRLPSDFRLLATSSRARDPDVKAALKYLESRGLSEREYWFWKLGMSNEPTLRRRIIVPSFAADGGLNYFTGRTIDKVPFMKYTNCEVFKSDVVFNELNIDWSRKLVIVEGPFDMMKCRGNVTCLLGSSLPEFGQLFNQIIIHETPVVLMLDNDMKDKTQMLAKKLSTYNIEVWIADLSGFHDPGEMTFAQTKKVINDAKRWSWNNLFLHKLNMAMTRSFRI